MMTINLWPILTAAAAAWVFGAIYYTLLGRVWMAAQGKTIEECKAEAAGRSKVAFYMPFVLSFIGAAIIAWVICGMLMHMGLFSIRAGAISGAFCWFGFVLTTIVINNAYAMRSWKLTAIDALHWLGSFLIIGAIVGGWPR